MHSSSPTINSNNNDNNNNNNDVPNTFSLGIDFSGVTEIDRNNIRNSSNNVIKHDKQTFRERFEAEKISRCDCSRRACS